MNTRFFSLFLSLFVCAPFMAQGSTQTIPRSTHFSGGSSSSGPLLREAKIQKINLIKNSKGSFLVDFSKLDFQSPLVELQAKGEHIGTLSIVNGSVQFENQTDQDFTFRGIPPLDGMKVISTGNITFEEEVLCKEGGVFDVAGRCHFQKGIRFEDSDAKVFLSRGTFDFDGASVVPQVHLVNYPTISVRKGALLENELMVSLEKGEQKPTLKNAGRFVSKTVYGQFDKILTAAGSLTDIQQAHVVCAKAINRGDLSIAKGYLETESFTNLKNMQVGDLELCSLETINRGLFKAIILKFTQGNFHNTKTATLDVFEKFTGNFNDFKDDGKTLFHGLAN